MNKRESPGKLFRISHWLAAPSFSDWTTITKDCSDLACAVPYDLETTPLQIRYTAHPDTTEKFLNLYDKSNSLLGWVQWDRGSVHVHDCGPSVWGTVPSDETYPQIWTVTKTGTHLTLEQNGKLVFSYEFVSTSSCSKLKGNIVAKVAFNKFSTLSASYKPYSGEETAIKNHVTNVRVTKLNVTRLMK